MHLSASASHAGFGNWPNKLLTTDSSSPSRGRCLRCVGRNGLAQWHMEQRPQGWDSLAVVRLFLHDGPLFHFCPTSTPAAAAVLKSSPISSYCSSHVHHLLSYALGLCDFRTQDQQSHRHWPFTWANASSRGILGIESSGNKWHGLLYLSPPGRRHFLPSRKSTTGLICSVSTSCWKSIPCLSTHLLG